MVRRTIAAALIVCPGMLTGSAEEDPELEFSPSPDEVPGAVEEFLETLSTAGIGAAIGEFKAKANARRGFSFRSKLPEDFNGDIRLRGAELLMVARPRRDAVTFEYKVEPPSPKESSWYFAFGGDESEQAFVRFDYDSDERLLTFVRVSSEAREVLPEGHIHWAEDLPKSEKVVRSFPEKVNYSLGAARRSCFLEIEGSQWSGSDEARTYQVSLLQGGGDYFIAQIILYQGEKPLPVNLVDRLARDYAPAEGKWQIRRNTEDGKAFHTLALSFPVSGAVQPDDLYAFLIDQIRGADAAFEQVMNTTESEG